jgi:beta-lactamase superfamily II metal-dependent hydrolase
LNVQEIDWLFTGDMEKSTEAVLLEVEGDETEKPASITNTYMDVSSTMCQSECHYTMGDSRQACMQVAGAAAAYVINLKLF